jgi:hypothetical protein
VQRPAAAEALAMAGQVPAAGGRGAAGGAVSPGTDP